MCLLSLGRSFFCLVNRTQTKSTSATPSFFFAALPIRGCFPRRGVEHVREELPDVAVQNGRSADLGQPAETHARESELAPDDPWKLLTYMVNNWMMAIFH